jgi:uncharacterized membrane protein YeaQ/YmgE (transglycosylase-associated protein family)
MGVFAWIIIGLLGGAIAKFLLPGKDPGGFILTIILGIVGAIIGGFIAVALGISDGVDDFDMGSVVLATAGAVLILCAYRLYISQRGKLA